MGLPATAFKRWLSAAYKHCVFVVVVLTSKQEPGQSGPSGQWQRAAASVEGTVM